MRILVWQWGRFGAGPRVAVELADGLRTAGAASVVLCLSEGAELLRPGPLPPRCELTVPTYHSPLGFGLRLAASPWFRRQLRTRVVAFRPDIAICAMPGLLDGEMAACLRRLDIPFAAVIHDAKLHPGDGLPLQMFAQRRLIARAGALIALSDHVARQLREQPRARGVPLLAARLPPFAFGPLPPPAGAHGGPLRLLCFGRLLPYKGLDLLADALCGLPELDRIVLRVVGQGPESPTLGRLRAMRNITVENRWVPEGEIGALLAWSDALILPYREASQSGVAAAAISARRWVISTAVGGLVEQFSGETLALLCPPEPAPIANAIRRLLTEPPRADPGSDPNASAHGWREASGELLAGLRQVFNHTAEAGLAFPRPGPELRTSARPRP